MKLNLNMMDFLKIHFKSNHAIGIIPIITSVCFKISCFNDKVKNSLD